MLVDRTVVSQLRDHVLDARVCVLRHPSSKTLVKWLREIGFEETHLTHGGGDIAGSLFDTLLKTAALPRMLRRRTMSPWLPLEVTDNHVTLQPSFDGVYDNDHTVHHGTIGAGRDGLLQ